MFYHSLIVQYITLESDAGFYDLFIPPRCVSLCIIYHQYSNSRELNGNLLFSISDKENIEFTPFYWDVDIQTTFLGNVVYDSVSGRWKLQCAKYWTCWWNDYKNVRNPHGDNLCALLQGFIACSGTSCTLAVLEFQLLPNRKINLQSQTNEQSYCKLAHLWTCRLSLT